MKERISSQNISTRGKFEINSFIDYVLAQLRLTTRKEVLSHHILFILPNIRYKFYEICVFQRVFKKFLAHSIFRFLILAPQTTS